jgi:hypothetical protein
MQNFERDEVVTHQPQRPSGRVDAPALQMYTVESRLPIESDGRIRYRIKSSDGKTVRIATEEQLSRAS